MNSTIHLDGRDISVRANKADRKGYVWVSVEVDNESVVLFVDSDAVVKIQAACEVASRMLQLSNKRKALDTLVEFTDSHSIDDMLAYWEGTGEVPGICLTCDHCVEGMTIGLVGGCCCGGTVVDCFTLHEEVS
jgi:hypothetical protein